MSAFTAVERLAEDIGRDIGRSNSKVQADLLNGLADGLAPCHDADLQACYIVDDLTPLAKKWITRLAGFLEPEASR